MPKSHRFFFMHCRSGHMLYAYEKEITQRRCERCGEHFITACEECGAKLRNSWLTNVNFLNRKPTSFPQKPSFCKECGKKLPWAIKEYDRIEKTGVWDLLHPQIVEISKPRFESGHYADAVEAALKTVNARVKIIHKDKTGKELDGSSLMRNCFSISNPIIKLGDVETESGRSIQQGYMDIFAGAMTGIRNPKAHDNIDLDPERAIHHLFLASLLFSKLDETS